MRKLAFLAAVAATFCTVACNKEISTSKVEAPVTSDDGRVEVTLTITGGAKTKSADQDIDDNLSVVHNIQFFAFNSDETIDTYVKVTSGMSGSMRVKAGQKKFWAVVNADDITNVQTLDELKAIKTQLADNADGFIMVGNSNVGTTPIPIEVKRLASRVVLKKVTAAFTSPAEAALDCVLKRVYLINVAGDFNLGATDDPTVWYSKMAYESPTGLDDLLNTTLSPSHDLKSSAYEVPSYHYCYQNHKQPDTQATTWSPRFTRIVAEVELGGTTYYYPVNIQYIDCGKSYEIENLTITRKGSTNPDQPITIQSGTFEITVKDWTVVPVTSGITI